MSRKHIANARINPDDLLHGWREESLLNAQENAMPIYKEEGTASTDVLPTEATPIEAGSFVMVLSNGQRFRVMAMEIVDGCEQ